MTDSEVETKPHIAFGITALHGVAGGAERVLVDVANGLHRRGFPVTVLTYEPLTGPSFYPLDYGIRRLDGRRREGAGTESALQAISILAQRNPLIGVAKWLVQYGPKIFRFRQMLRLAKPDVAIGFLPSTYPYLTIAATGTGIRTIASLHNVPDRDLGGDPERWDQNPIDISIRRSMLRRADAATVLLPSFVEQLEASIKPKTTVIPNLIEPRSGPLADVSTDVDRNTILAVGRLTPAKDHGTLIRAWALIAEHYPAWTLRIIGDGLLLSDLVELIDDLRVPRISIDEPTDEITAAYMSSKFLVMPSIFEGFGLVTAEAMACGLPVIGFADCEGTNEIIEPGHNGVLAQPGEDRPGALAAEVAKLIDDEELRKQLAANAPASTLPFRPEAVIDQWEQLVRRVAGQGSDR